MQSKDFSDRREDDMKRFGVEETCSFVILYGTEFRLKMMSLVGEYKQPMYSSCYAMMTVTAQCREERDAWVKALQYVMHGNNFRTHLVLRRCVPVCTCS